MLWDDPRSAVLNVWAVTDPSPFFRLILVFRPGILNVIPVSPQVAPIAVGPYVGYDVSAARFPVHHASPRSWAGGARSRVRSGGRAVGS